MPELKFDTSQPPKHLMVANKQTGKKEDYGILLAYKEIDPAKVMFSVDMARGCFWVVIFRGDEEQRQVMLGYLLNRRYDAYQVMAGCNNLDDVDHLLSLSPVHAA